MFKAFLFLGGFYQWFYLEIQGFHMQGGFLNRIIHFICLVKVVFQNAAQWSLNYYHKPTFQKVAT